MLSTNVLFSDCISFVTEPKLRLMIAWIIAFVLIRYLIQTIDSEYRCMWGAWRPYHLWFPSRRLAPPVHFYWFISSLDICNLNLLVNMRSFNNILNVLFHVIAKYTHSTCQTYSNNENCDWYFQFTYNTSQNREMKDLVISPINANTYMNPFVCLMVSWLIRVWHDLQCFHDILICFFVINDFDII